MAAEERWPEFTRQAFDRGVRSTLSIPLPVQRQVIGALNLYASESHRFDAGVVVELADNFGAYAAVAIANTRLYLSAASLAEQMQAAMTSRAVIEQAKGMLMVQRQCNAEDAFDILVAMSQQTHRRLRHVATALVQEMTTAGD
jgi:GAF domain-containing protein